MAYNYFPTGYQPAQIYYPTQQTQQQSNGIIWVQGEAGAKSYLVAPNTTVQLWDSEAQTIYLKSADARRDAMGRYSREGSYGYSMAGDMAMELKELMQDAPDAQTRQDIQRIVDRLSQM